MGIEGHQVSILATYPPASVVGVHCRGIPYLLPQTLVGSTHLASGAAQDILSDGTHPWHFPYRNPELIVESVGRRHPPLSHSMGGGPVLVGSQIRVLSSDGAATGRAPADPHPVLGTLGSRPGRDIGDVGEVYSLFRQPAPTARAGLLSNRHFYWSISDLTGVGR